MLFYSPEYFLLFFPFVLILFFKSKEFNFDYKILLILTSIFFYAYWNYYYLPVIIFILVINFYIGKKLLYHSNKIDLILGIFFNLLILLIFKYLDFLIQNINLVFDTSIKKTNLPFPLAISFVTFQLIAYLINCYDEVIKKISFKNFSLFLLFFPQLIAGPIVSYKEMIGQFDSSRILIFNKRRFSFGLVIFFIGFFKKIYLADTLGIFVDQNINDFINMSFVNSWLTSLSFTFQFYFDFTAYVDMATGSALMMNIYLPKNFDSPFKATSIINFWQRWHITLTNFLTNYFYKPWLLSLKKITFFNSMSILFIVFLLAGLWHGPSWNYVIFGGLNGIGLIVNHYSKKKTSIKINYYFSIFLTFNFINISFVFFKIKEIEKSTELLLKMFLLSESSNYSLSLESYSWEFIFTFIISVIVCFLFSNTYKLVEETLKNKKK